VRQAFFFLRSFFSSPIENLLRALQRCKNKIAPREGFHIIRVSKREARPTLLVVKDEPKKGAAFKKLNVTYPPVLFHWTTPIGVSRADLPSELRPAQT
jgi:hypothetical protein